MGGAFDIKQFIMDYYDDNCYFNNPPDYLPQLNDSWYLDQLKWMDIVLGTGDMDMCLEDNKRMSELLYSKGIGHHLEIRANTGHDWNWWKQMFPDYLARINF
jgi:esterase/lipase superfamily enzyme